MLITLAKKDKDIKPINIFGYFLIAMGAICILFAYWAHLKGFNPPIYFVIAVTTWYLLTGVGVIKQTTWGYYLFIFFLYVLFISFPIGTYISYKTLSYMKRKEIKKYFLKK